MAFMYQTTMSPTKLELLSGWMSTQPWFEGDPENVTMIGAYRFDDPEGEVGIEGHFLTAGDDSVYHVPVTYRSAALAEGEGFLLGTTEHGVLGTRWVYNAMGDPVYRHVVAQVIAQGGTEAEEFLKDSEGSLTPLEIFTRLKGSGTPSADVPELHAARVGDEDGLTVAQTGLAMLALKRVANRSGDGSTDAKVLRATWPGQEEPQIVAILHFA